MTPANALPKPRARRNAHVAQNTSGRSSAIDVRTTRHGCYGIGQRFRKGVEEIFGWMKPSVVSDPRVCVDWRTQLAGYLVAPAYNLVRMARLAPVEFAS
jgi:hypothetical protein